MPSHMTLQSIVVFLEFKDNEKLTRTDEQTKKTCHIPKLILIYGMNKK